MEKQTVKRGRPPSSTTAENRLLNKQYWRSQHHLIYLGNTVHETWKKMKNEGVFANDTAFATHLLSLEIKRRKSMSQAEIAKKNYGTSRKRSIIAADGGQVQDTLCPQHSTPIKSIRIESSPHEASELSLPSMTSDLDVTGISMSIINDTVVIENDGYENQEDASCDDETEYGKNYVEKESFYFQEALEELHNDENDSGSETDTALSGDLERYLDDEDDTALFGDNLDDSVVMPDAIGATPDEESVEPNTTSSALHANDAEAQSNIFSLFQEEESLQAEVTLIKATKVICCVDLLLALFNKVTCGVNGCQLPVSVTSTRLQGCTLIVYYKCPKEHTGKWSTSHECEGLWSNNIQAAASTLITGNNHKKLDLFAKCLGLLS